MISSFIWIESHSNDAVNAIIQFAYLAHGTRILWLIRSDFILPEFCEYDAQLKVVQDFIGKKVPFPVMLQTNADIKWTDVIPGCINTEHNTILRCIKGSDSVVDWIYEWIKQCAASKHLCVNMFHYIVHFLNQLKWW